VIDESKLMGPESHDTQGIWYGRVARLLSLIGHLEPSDVLWKVIEQDVGACTRAYLAKDAVSWHSHRLRIQDHLRATLKGAIECYPTWC